MLTEEQRKQITDAYRVFTETMPETLLTFAKISDQELRDQAHKLYFAGLFAIAMLTGNWLNGAADPAEVEIATYLTSLANYHQEVKDLIEKM